MKRALFIAFALISSLAGFAQAQLTLHYVHPDHLNTPTLVADSAGTVVWRNNNTEPFGNSLPDENPSGLGVFEYPISHGSRQYRDKETNLAQNGKRDYDPALGRFQIADPLGLKHHLNLYSYVNLNPLSYMDPTGEAATLAWCFGGPIPCAVGATAAVGSLIWAQSQMSKTRASAQPSSSIGAQQCPPSDEECEKLRERDETACRLIAGTRYGSRGLAICMRSASDRYAECLRFGVNGVKTPLHGVDTPL